MHNRDAYSNTFQELELTLHGDWETHYSNIALAQSNIGLIGNYHIYHTWITNFKRIRLQQNTFNLIFL